MPFPSKADWYSTARAEHIGLSQPSVDGHTDSFQILAVVTDAVTNVGLQIPSRPGLLLLTYHSASLSSEYSLLFLSNAFGNLYFNHCLFNNKITEVENLALTKQTNYTISHVA